MVQTAEGLPSKHEALSLNSSTRPPNPHPRKKINSSFRKAAFFRVSHKLSTHYFSFIILTLKNIKIIYEGCGQSKGGKLVNTHIY
jgi:hypothetical protein